MSNVNLILKQIEHGISAALDTEMTEREMTQVVSLLKQNTDRLEYLIGQGEVPEGWTIAS